MRLLADVHISPRTVEFLRSLGHDVQRVSSVLSPTAADADIVVLAIQDSRVILTQDLAALVALGGGTAPSVVTLRLSSSRVEHVNEILAKVLPGLEEAAAEGAVVTVEDGRVRRRRLPVG